MKAVPTAPLAILLAGALTLTACGGSDDNTPWPPNARGSGDSGPAPDPAECELGVAEIKAKIPDATPRVSEGGPTDSCSWQAGKSKVRQPCLVTVFGDPNEEFTTMDEAKAKDDSHKTYRLVLELGSRAWLEHGVYTTVQWPTKRLIVAVSSETLDEADVIDIAKAVHNDLTKLGA